VTSRYDSRHFSISLTTSPIRKLPGGLTNEPCVDYIKYIGPAGYVYTNGIEIGRAAASTTGLGQGLGSHIYSALDKFDSNGRRKWISTASFGRTLAPDVKEVLNRVIIAPQFLEHARVAVAPGTTLVITDLPVSSQTRSEPGFDILTTD
jgi:hypothetical protein